MADLIQFLWASENAREHLSRHARMQIALESFRYPHVRRVEEIFEEPSPESGLELIYMIFIEFCTEALCRRNVIVIFMRPGNNGELFFLLKEQQPRRKLPGRPWGEFQNGRCI